MSRGLMSPYMCFLICVSLYVFPYMCLLTWPDVSLYVFPYLCFLICVSLHVFPHLCFLICVSLYVFPDVSLLISAQMVLSVTGEVFSWGGGDFGQLGLGDVRSSLSPALVSLSLSL